MSIKIAINGLGRIGKSILRALCERNYQDIEVVAINGTQDVADAVHLTKYDSVHGRFPGEIHATKDDGSSFIEIKSYSGNITQKIKYISERNPELISWKDLGVDVVLECTGKFTKALDARKHLESGAKKVLVSAPCAGADSTIVFGVNNHALKPKDQVISIGSCTTNALAPVAKVLHENFGIEKGFMTTIHAYTSDQNLLDGSHKDPRRARAAAMSIIPTSTGAAKTLGLVLPELDGKLDGAATRVPVPNVSVVDLTFLASKKITKDEINQAIQSASDGYLSGILGVAPAKMVSIDFNHNQHSSIFDPFETFVVGENLARILAWYDNEWGFSLRMLDCARLAMRK